MLSLCTKMLDAIVNIKYSLVIKGRDASDVLYDLIKNVSILDENVAGGIASWGSIHNVSYYVMATLLTKLNVNELHFLMDFTYWDEKGVLFLLLKHVTCKVGSVVCAGFILALYKPDAFRDFIGHVFVTARRLIHASFNSFSMFQNALLGMWQETINVPISDRFEKIDRNAAAARDAARDAAEDTAEDDDPDDDAPEDAAIAAAALALLAIEEEARNAAYEAFLRRVFARQVSSIRAAAAIARETHAALALEAAPLADDDRQSISERAREAFAALDRAVEDAAAPNITAYELDNVSERTREAVAALDGAAEELQDLDELAAIAALFPGW